MAEPITTIEIKLSRQIDEDGAMQWKMVLPVQFSCVEVLGLLEMAKAHIYREIARRSNG